MGVRRTAVKARQPGGRELLETCDEELGAPGPGELLIRVEAAGVNFIDVYHRTGLYPQPPPIPLGLEGAGTVMEGSGSLSAGTRVAWAQVPGSYASHVLAPEEAVAVVPEGVSSEQAAALMLQGMTAHYLSRSTFPLQAGQTALVHAAAGGVGQLLCQLGARAGATIVGTTSTEEKAALARNAGAAEVILYTSESFADRALALTSGRGVDVVYDSVGAATFDDSLRCLAPRGMLVLFGQSSGPVPKIDPQILNRGGSLFLTRPSLKHYIATRDEFQMRAGELFAMVAAGELKVAIDSTFPLAHAAQAHERLESRASSGKLLLLP